MRLFKKFGLLAFMTLLLVGVGSTVGLSTNKSHNAIENNVTSVAKAQHVFDLPKSAATIDHTEKQAYVDESITCEVSKFAYSDMSVFVTAKIVSKPASGVDPEIFSVGYYKGDVALPATISFNVLNKEGNVLPDRYSAVLPKNNNANGDPTFLSIYHRKEIPIEVSVNIPAETTVKNDSIKIDGLYYVSEESTTDENGATIRKTTVHQDYSYNKTVSVRKSYQATNFNQYGIFTPRTVTNYCGYYAVSFDFNNVLSIDDYLDLIKILSPVFLSGSTEKTNIENLKTGKTYVNTRIILTKGTSAYYVEDLDGKIHEIAAIPANHSTSYGTSNVVFNFPSKGINGVKNFYLSKPMLTISVINRETNKEVSASDFSYRFGTVGCGIAEIKNYEGNVISQAKTPKAINSDLITIILFLSITVIFAVACVSMFIYKNKKYADNEFKRLDKPSYVKTSIIAYLFFVIAGLDIYYLIMRTNALNNSELFANPVDIIVIVFTLVGFLLGCFFIRKYYIAFKETLERRRREKLNLNADKDVDAGVLTVDTTAKTESKK